MPEALHRAVAAILGSDELSPDAPGWLEIYDSAVLLIGVAALALVIALLTDALVTTRLAHALGRLPRNCAATRSCAASARSATASGAS